MWWVFYCLKTSYFMDHKYPVGLLVYSLYDCLGMIIGISKQHYSSKYLVEWYCHRFYGSYTEEEISNLRKNLLELLERTN